MNEACDDVYYFMKDRYFVGEIVEAILRSKWYPAELVCVVPPSAEDLQAYREEQDEELSMEDKLVMLEQYGPPPELFKYEVRELFDSDEKTEAGPIHTVKHFHNFSLMSCFFFFINFLLALRSQLIAYEEKRACTHEKNCDYTYGTAYSLMMIKASGLLR